MAKTSKYREGMAESASVACRSMCAMRRVPRRPVIWLHAVSVGEVLAVEPAGSGTGCGFSRSPIADFDHHAHRACAGARTIRRGPGFLLSAGLSLGGARLSQCAAAGLLILAETEFWPNLLNGCFRREIPVAVVNARISDRSWPRYQMLRRLWRPILGQISRVLAQSETMPNALEPLAACRSTSRSPEI